MKKVIDGKLYDTDKSLWIHTFDLPPYEAFDPAGNDAVLSETHCLYQSDKGQFVMIVTTSFTGYPCDKNDGQLLSREEARKWLEENDAPEDAYGAAGFKVEKG
jgi:hypothetical protein